MAPKKKVPDVVIVPPEHHETQQLQTGYDRESIEELQADKLRGIVETLENMPQITNDVGEEMDFSGDTKETFIGYFVEGYEIVDRMLSSIHETGRFLADVRNNLKPQKLFLTWLNYAGFPTATAYNYLRLHDHYQEDLPRYSQIGVKKLLAVAKLTDCKEYMNENVEEIALKPATDVVREINERLKQRPKKKGGGRKPEYEIFHGVVIRPSGDGSRIVLEKLNKKDQETLIQAIKVALSQINA
jgi:hypothetical protein